MAQEKNRAYYRKKRKTQKIIRLAVVIALMIAALVCIIILITKLIGGSSEKSSEDTSATTEAVSSGETAETTGSEESTEPADPVVESSATFGVTGDILLHNAVLAGAEQEDGSYDFTSCFDSVSSYWSALDYMIVNLEVPCGGDGYVTGYPTFDAPDEIVDDLKAAGVDMCLTATNHTNDCGEDGILHTQEVLKDAGMDYTGTRTDTDDSYVLTKDINGIKFGFVCYTYDTREEITDDKSLNGIAMTETSADLVNSFCYSDAGLEELYESAEADLKTMDEAGCDVTVFFMHWGTEYSDEPSEFIQGIAQNLSDLGVDIIIGGHPHVIQKFDVLEGEDGNTTYCLYSLGNAISSQRKEIMDPEEPRGYTEDGLVISFTYDKYSDGKVELSGVDVLPTWVDISDSVYYIVPLSGSADPSDWNTVNYYDSIDAYNRVMERVGEKYFDLRKELGQDEVAEEIEY